MSSRFTLTERRTWYRNEVGLFLVDDAQGRINGQQPGDRGYAAAALARRVVLFERGQEAGAVASLTLPGGSYFGTYLVQGSTADRLLARNPQNRPGRRPVAFFSVTAANPDLFGHVRQPAADRLAMEDQWRGGDRDFNDAVLRLEFQAVGPMDTQPPVVTITSPTPGLLTRQDVLVAGRVTDDLSGVSRLQARLVGGLATLADGGSGALTDVTFDPRTGAFQFPAGLRTDGSADGPYTVLLRAEDGFHNVGTATVAFTLDATPPRLSSALAHDTAPGGATNADGVTSDPTLAGSVTDVSPIASLLAWFDNRPASSAVDVHSARAADGRLSLDRARLDAIFGTSLPDGPHTLHVRATDAAGNVTDRAVGLTLDTQRPTVSIDRPAQDLVTRQNVEIAGHVADTGSGPASLVARIDSGPAVPVTLDAAGRFHLTTPLPLNSTSDGPHEVVFEAVDRAGNLSVATPYRFTFDTTAPAVTFGLDQASDSDPVGDGQTTVNPVTLIGQTEPNLPVNLFDDRTGTKLASTNSDGDGRFRFPNVTLTMGANPFRVDATDAAGNVGSSRQDITFLCTFNDLTGWTTSERGGTPTGQGDVVVEGDHVVMREGDSFEVTLSHTFTVPAGATSLSFLFDGPAFDTSDPAAINDAFEAAFLDDAGQPLVHTIGPGRDAFFNITEGEAPALGSEATYDAATHLVTLDLSGLFAGTSATLVLRLVNNDTDTESSVAITCVMLPENAQVIQSLSQETSSALAANLVAPDQAVAAPINMQSTPVESNPGMIVTISDGGSQQSEFVSGEARESQMAGAPSATSGVQTLASTGSESALTPAGQDLGFRITTFATGFPQIDGAGPLGIAFPDSGGVLVTDEPGNVWHFPTADDGQSTAGMSPASTLGVNHAFDLAKANGTIYMVDNANSQIVQLSDDGASSQVVISGVYANGIVANPFVDSNGHQHLFASSRDSLLEIDPIARTVSTLVTGPWAFDGVSTDGRIVYAAERKNSHILGFDIATKQLVFDSGTVPGEVDGTASGTGTLAGNIFVNTNSAGLWEVNLTTLEQTQIADGPSATRGDFVAVAPDGSLLVTQTDEIDRIIPPPGGGFGVFHVFVHASAPGTQFASGSTVLISGNATSILEQTGVTRPIAAVTINGVPVDALDASGNFFARVQVAPGRTTYNITATDIQGETGRTSLTLEGLQVPLGPIDFSLFSDVSASFAGDYARTSFNEDTHILYADLRVHEHRAVPGRCAADRRGEEHQRPDGAGRSTSTG